MVNGLSLTAGVVENVRDDRNDHPTRPPLSDGCMGQRSSLMEGEQSQEINRGLMTGHNE